MVYLLITLMLIAFVLIVIAKIRKSNRLIKIAEEQNARLSPLSLEAAAFLVKANKLLSESTNYVMKKDWDAELETSRKLYKKIVDTVKSLNANINEYPELKQFCELHSNKNILINRNRTYKQKELHKYKNLFNDIGGLSLDAQQRDAVVTDEYNNLIIAGAGSGKTLTVVGKVKYLIEAKKVKPEEILVTSFTRAAVSDLREKIHNAGVEGVHTKTFHKIGLEILGEVAVANENTLSLQIEKYLTKTLGNDNRQSAAFIEFYGMRQLVELENASKESFQERMTSLKATNFYTLKGMVETTKGKLDTIQGERVKSKEELLIANFLFLNGIEYEYEKSYSKPIPESLKEENRRAYQPDFYLTDYDIWLEHFGINATGRPEWIKDPVEQQKYVDGIEWKRKVHKQCNTKLIESYSYWNEDHDLLNKLSTRLSLNGIKVTPDSIRNAEYCKILLENRAFYESTGKLIHTFIMLAKSNNETVEAIEDSARMAYKSDGSMWHRFELFMSFARPIMKEYTNFLRKNNQIDFDDMINLAAEKVRVEGISYPYRYVIVDEYQDISKSRLGLILAIREKTDARLVCVGDDWQSIYRFAGSDVTLFTNFEKLVGYHEKLRIEHTYRNSQQLVDIASKFILKNKSQIPKKMVAIEEKSNASPISIVGADDKQMALSYALNSILSTIRESETIAILGRNKNDISSLIPEGDSSDRFRIVSNNKKANTADATVYYKSRHEAKETVLDFRTVHKSKGLEADYVVVIGLENRSYGFPNMIEDDPILNLLLADRDDFKFSEERRLFYVALTRTKNSVWLLTPSEMNGNTQSQFIEELKEFHDSRITYYTDKSDNAQARCPKCGGVLLVRTNESAKNQFVGCSNFPYCDKTYNDVRIVEDNKNCPECGGLLSRRQNRTTGEVFFGCTNYPDYCSFACDLDETNSARPEYAPTRTPYDYSSHRKRRSNTSGIKCKKCGSNMVRRAGKFGVFFGCENYPSCTYTLDNEYAAEGKAAYHNSYTANTRTSSKNSTIPGCPNCGLKMVIRHGPHGNFYGCTSYPQCTGRRKL